jgi:hypothetical protein
MSYAEIVSSLAFMVSLASFTIAYLSFRRTSKLNEPNAWLEIESITENCWKVTIQVRNPTRYTLRLGKIGVPITRVPVDAKQNFLLGDYEAALRECGDDLSKLASATSGKDTILTMEVPAHLQSVPSGAMGVVNVLLFRGKLSVAPKVAISLSYLSMEETPRPKSLTLRGQLTGARRIQFQLTRV